MYQLNLFWYDKETQELLIDLNFNKTSYAKEEQYNSYELYDVINNAIYSYKTTDIYKTDKVAVFVIFKDNEEKLKYAVTDDESKIDNFLKEYIDEYELI